MSDNVYVVEIAGGRAITVTDSLETALSQAEIVNKEMFGRITRLEWTTHVRNEQVWYTAGEMSIRNVKYVGKRE